MVSVECPEVLPETFGSPVQSDLLSETSYSTTDTGEFIRNVTECFATSLYSSSFAKLQDQVASEDEVVFPFGSDTSSHQSLSLEIDASTNPWPYFVESQATGQKLECSPSPTLRPNEQGRSSYSSTVVLVERVDRFPSNDSCSSPIEQSVDNICSSLWPNHQPINVSEREGRTDNDKDTPEQDEVVEPAEVGDREIQTDNLDLDMCIHEEDDLGLTPTPGRHPFKADHTTSSLYYQLSKEESLSSSESIKVPDPVIEPGQENNDQDELDRLSDGGDLYTSEVDPDQPRRRSSHSGLTERSLNSLHGLLLRRASLPSVQLLPPLPPIILTTEFYSSSRKLSDPAVKIRNEIVHHRTITHQRCLSDSETPQFSIEDDEAKSEEEGGSSMFGYDSGYHDEKSSRFQESLSYFSPRVSLQSSDLNSLDEGPAAAASTVPSCNHRLRRPTPHPIKDDNNQQFDDHTHCSAIPPYIGTNVQPRERLRRSLLKNFSQSSLGGVSLASIGASSESQSVSLNSIVDYQSSQASVTDLLSNLGFDDFESPQYIPDRFIPSTLDHARPSSMRSISIDQYDSFDCDHDSVASGKYDCGVTTRSNSFASVLSTSCLYNDEPSGALPLGATADNFESVPTIPTPVQSVDTNVLIEAETGDQAPGSTLYPNTANISYFNRMLETVPEETASDLSASPRWTPRVSIDHSVIDVMEGKLGASLNIQKPRKRSLPQREGYKVSVGSLVDSEAGESIQFSFTSYDDEIAAAEKEKDLHAEEQQQSSRRRRRGVYTPPPSLLSWLSTQQPIHEEDTDNLPWPFSEQVKLRKSLTEIQQAQEAAALNEMENSHIETTAQQHSSSSCDDLKHDVHDNFSAPSAHLSTSIPRLSPGPPPPPLGEEMMEHSSSMNTSHSNSPRMLSPPPHYQVEGEINNMPQFSPNRNQWSGGENSAESEDIEHKEIDYQLRCRVLEERLATERAQSSQKEDHLSTEIKELESRLRVTQEESTREFLAMAETCSRLQEELEACKSDLIREKAAANRERVKSQRSKRRGDLEEVKIRMRQERPSELKMLEQKHTQEVDDLKHALQLKTRELQQLASRLDERTEAASALSSELKEHKRVAEIQESKLRASLVDQKNKLERQYHQEKVAALARFQEEALEDKQRELYACKMKLQEEKKGALARLEAKMAEQLFKLQLLLGKMKEQSSKELAVLREELESQLADEREKTNQLREALTTCRKELEEAQRSLKGEEKKQLVKGREMVRANKKQQRNILTGLFEEWQKTALVTGQKKPRPLSLGNNPVTEVLEVAMANVRTGNELLRQQVAELKQQVEKEKQANTALHKHKTIDLRKIKAHAEVDKQKSLKALKEKLETEHAQKITNFLEQQLSNSNQMERGGAEKEIGPRDSPSHQEQSSPQKQDSGPAVPLTTPTHSPCRREMEALQKEVKVQQHGMQRARALYSEKIHEVTDLQAHIKQLTMERMQLEKSLQNLLRSPAAK